MMIQSSQSSEIYFQPHFYLQKPEFTQISYASIKAERKTPFRSKTSIGAYAMSKQPKLSTREAAAYLGVRPNTLEIWRCKHRGPKYAKLGSRIVYDPDDLDAYFAARSISTRDTELDRLGAGK